MSDMASLVGSAMTILDRARSRPPLAGETAAAR
jgi:hypothetical protein